jgi:MFS family permease
VRETLAILAGKRTFWLLSFGTALKALFGYAQSAFIVSFFIRNHPAEIAHLAAGMGLKSLGYVGLMIGLISGSCGTISILTGGWLADKAAVKDVRNALLPSAITVFAAMPVFIIAVSVKSASLALGLLVIPYLLNSICYAPAYAMTQSIVPAHMRASAAAILLFIMNFIGLGLGPLVAGMVSDFVTMSLHMGGAEGVRWGLIASAFSSIPSGILFLMVRKKIRQDLEQ